MYARYTTYLRDLMLNDQTKTALNKALSTYPLYKAPKNYDLIPTREQLNEKLLNHYKYREIGFETVGRFLDELEITMCEIMPRYNELFKTVETMAELPSPFDNVDVTETFEQEQTNTARSNGTSESSGTNSQSANSTTTNESTSEVEGESVNNNKKLEVDTPQNQINVATKNIEGLTYASKGDWTQDFIDNSQTTTTNDNATNATTSEGSNTSEMTSENSSESSGTLKHTFTKKGNQGVNTYAHDMNEFRTSIIDVVDQIINDKRIAELFMLVY